jgi:long-chain acyl-CoA synthetase
MSAGTTTWSLRCDGTQLVADWSPNGGVQMRLVDEHATEVPTGTPGEIQVRGRNVMKGYWNLPEVTANPVVGGWFSTGDIGLVDEDGYFFIIARMSTPT